MHQVSSNRSIHLCTAASNPASKLSCTEQNDEGELVDHTKCPLSNAPQEAQGGGTTWALLTLSLHSNLQSNRKKIDTQKV